MIRLRARAGGVRRHRDGVRRHRGGVRRHRGSGRGSGVPRWAALYARSRRVPASAVAAAVAVAALTAVERGMFGGFDPRMTALALASAIALFSGGLAGQDLALDRAAALAWAPRRAAHLLLAGAVAAGMWLAPYLVAGDAAPVAFVVRDAAGFLGLAGLGAAMLGGRYAWAPPIAVVMPAFFASPETTLERVAAWPVAAVDADVAAWTAVALLVAGLSAYALGGPRR